MAFAAAADRLNRACTRAFGESATVDGTAVSGVYYAPFEEAFGVSTSEPRLAIRAADVDAAVGDAVVCTAGSFRVRKVEPDGTGWTVLRLEVA